MIIKNGVLVYVQAEDLSPDGEFVIPDGVTKIVDGAFSYCTELTSVTIPDSVERIECYAFKHCIGLKSLTIGRGVKYIGNGAFYNCSGLTSITIPNGAVLNGGWTFEECKNLTEVILPSDLEALGMGTFDGCAALTSITLPDSITIFGEGLFHQTGLRSTCKNYKAFQITETGKLVCRKKYYAVGKKASVKGELKLCASGIHYCTNLFEIFNYYAGEYDKDFVIAECEVSKEKKCSKKKGISKKCARWIIPQRILTREEVIKILNVGTKKKKN